MNVNRFIEKKLVIEKVNNKKESYCQLLLSNAKKRKQSEKSDDQQTADDGICQKICFVITILIK